MPICFITQPIHPMAVTFLQAQGVEVRFASAPTLEAARAEVGNADAVITRDLGFDATAIAAAPQLRIIACHGSGTNRIAVGQAAQRGIVVTRAVNANSRSVAELTIALLLAAARRICPADAAVRSGDWGFRYQAPGMEVYGKTLGLVGFGAIARHVAQIAHHGLGMRVVAWSPHVPEEVFHKHGVTRLPDLSTLLEQVDVVSLHRPVEALEPPTLTAERLALLKKGAIVLNTSRGLAIDTVALRARLEAGDLAVAALDVLPHEPPAADEPMLTAPNSLLTPHIGASTEEALQKMAMMCAQQVLDCLSGKTPEHALGVEQS